MHPAKLLGVVFALPPTFGFLVPHQVVGGVGAEEGCVARVRLLLLIVFEKSSQGGAFCSLQALQLCRFGFINSLPRCQFPHDRLLLWAMHS